MISKTDDNEYHHFSTARITAMIGQMKRLVFQADISDSDFRKYLYAIQHVERYPARDGLAGRPGRFPRERLVRDAVVLKEFVRDATGGRISLLNFIGNYLSLLYYPSDLRVAYDRGEISLAEARILARITRGNLGAEVKRRAVDIRRELIKSHRQRKGSQGELKRRVDERLNRTPRSEAAEVSLEVTRLTSRTDELLEFDERDTRHLFWEEIKSLIFLVRELDVDSIAENDLHAILSDIQGLFLQLRKYKAKDPAAR